MTRTACDVFNPNGVSTMAHRDAVITSANNGIRYGDGARHMDVDAVSVRAIPRRRYVNGLHRNVTASIDGHVKHFTVDQIHSVNCDVVRVHYRQCLHVLYIMEVK